jgi:osmotically-inducible protein OsmY
MRRRRLRSLACGTVAWAAAACDRPPQPHAYDVTVNEQLRRADVVGVKARWPAPEPVLLLVGSVETAAERATAEDIARKVVGEDMRVLNDVAVMPREDADTELQRALDRLVESRPAWKLRTRSLRFVPGRGLVTIAGDVADEPLRTVIVSDVGEVATGRDVLDQLRVGSP